MAANISPVRANRGVQLVKGTTSIIDTLSTTKTRPRAYCVSQKGMIFVMTVHAKIVTTLGTSMMMQEIVVTRQDDIMYDYEL